MQKIKYSRLVIILAHTALFFFCSAVAQAQLKNTKIFFKRDKALTQCYEEYILDSLGEFFAIGGCEGKNTISIGVYQLRNDTISFQCKEVKSFPPIFRTEESQPESDTLVKITILTVLNHPVPASFQIDAIETDGRFFKSYTVNEKGEILINPYKYKSLRLTTLNHYYTGWQYVDVTHRNQKIFLHLPENFFVVSYPFTLLFNDFSALLKPDGLYDLQGKNNLFPVRHN
jgi:hypothetical protein